MRSKDCLAKARPAKNRDLSRLAVLRTLSSADIGAARKKTEIHIVGVMGPSRKTGADIKGITAKAGGVGVASLKSQSVSLDVLELYLIRGARGRG